MKILYAPWREQYSRSTHKKKDTCVFCIDEKKDTSEDQSILYNGKHCYVALNIHPYNAGHLLVVPYAHKEHLYNLDVAAQHEMMELIAHSSAILQNSLKCEGLNVGLNCGTPSGGSIPDHIHFHVVPRWKGDTNFLTVLADTKVISFDLKEVFRKLKPHFDKLKSA